MPLARRGSLNLQKENEAALERRKAENRTLMTEVLGAFVKEVNTPELGKLADAQVQTRKAVEGIPSLVAAEARDAMAEMAESQKTAVSQGLRPLVLMVMILGVAALVMLALLLLRSPSGMAATSPTTPELMNETQAAVARLSSLKTEVTALLERVKTLQAQENETLTRLKVAQDSLQKATLAAQAMAANRETEQAEIERLLRLNQSFQFRLAPTNTGEVVVEIPASAQPFTLNGRRYITVTTPATP